MSPPQRFDPERFHSALLLVVRPRDPGQPLVPGYDVKVFGTAFFIENEEVFGKQFCGKTSSATLITAAHNLTRQKHDGLGWQPDPQGELLPEVEIRCYHKANRDDGAETDDEAETGWTRILQLCLEEGSNCWLDGKLEWAIVRLALGEGCHPDVLRIMEEVDRGDTVAVLGFQRTGPDEYAPQCIQCTVPTNWAYSTSGSLNYTVVPGQRPLESGISGAPVLKVPVLQSGRPAVAIHTGRDNGYYNGTPLARVLEKPKLLVKVVGLLVRGKFSKAVDVSKTWPEPTEPRELEKAVGQYASGIGYLQSGAWEKAREVLEDARSAFKKLGQPVDLAFISAALDAVEALQVCSAKGILQPMDSRKSSLLPPAVRRSVRRIDRYVSLYHNPWWWRVGLGVLLIFGTLTLGFGLALRRASLPPVPCTVALEADGQPVPGPQYSVEKPAGSPFTLKVALKEPTGGDIDPNGATFDWGFYPEDSSIAIGNRNYTLHYRVPDDGRNYQIIVVSARIGARYCQQVLEINISD